LQSSRSFSAGRSIRSSPGIPEFSGFVLFCVLTFPHEFSMARGLCTSQRGIHVLERLFIKDQLNQWFMLGQNLTDLLPGRLSWRFCDLFESL